MSDESLRDALRKVRFFESFTDTEIIALSGAGHVEQFDSLANVMIEGEPTWGIYVVLEGQVSILKNNSVTQEAFEVAQLQAGACFGEMSLIDDAPRSATVRCLTACKVFSIPKSGFDEFLEGTPGARERFQQSCIQVLVRRLRELDGHFVTSQYQLWKSALTTRKEAA